MGNLFQPGALGGMGAYYGNYIPNNLVSTTPIVQPVAQPIIQPKPAYDPSLPKGDTLCMVVSAESASKIPMNPNTRVVAFKNDEDIMYVVTSDASGSRTVRICKFYDVTDETPITPQYVTMEEFNRFKEEVLNGQQFIRNNRNGAGDNARKSKPDKSSGDGSGQN